MSVLFSVVTVVRSDLAGLKKTRKSLEEQKYRNWVHIVIDGASEKPTQNYLKSLPEKNTIYVSEPDSGIYNAMNKAWKIADPESFVYFLNARDVFADSNSLWEATKALRTNLGSNWGCATHEEIQQDGTGWVCKLVSPPSIPNQLYAYGYRSHQAVVMKAKFIARLGGFNEKYKLAADWELIARALADCKPKVWSHSLGRFELGGISSHRIIDAHLELKSIRRDFLIKNLRDRILDDLWCAIYLHFSGFKNYFTPLLYLFYPEIRKSKRNSKYKEKSRSLKNINFRIGIFSIQILKTPRKYEKLGKRRIFQSLKRPDRSDLVLWLHARLQIKTYSNSINTAKSKW